MSSDAAILEPTLTPISEPSANPARDFLHATGLLEKFAPVKTLNEQFQTEHPQFTDLFPVLEADPELLKRFLKFANGGWFNSRISIDSPYSAYTQFGTEGFYKVTMAAFLAHGIGELGTRFKIWPHLESTARVAQSIAFDLAPKFVEDAFAAALFHDALVPPMERALPDYLYFLECAMNLDPHVTRLENNCHKFDHAQAAGELASTLAFKPHIVEAIARHHENPAAVTDPNARTVLSLLILAKKTLELKLAEKRKSFETASEKILLTNLATALAVTPARIQTALRNILDNFTVSE